MLKLILIFLIECVRDILIIYRGKHMKCSNPNNLNGITKDKGEAINLLMQALERAEERADKEGWIDAEDLEKELDIRK